MLADKRILLIIGGGISAYKLLETIRRLRERGASVRAIMTRAAHEFVTPLSVSSLTGDKVYDDLFDLTDEAEMGHIELSRDADLLVVAPATADLMARMAHGLASDLATTALLATDKPVLIAPAMNVRMWTHAATRRNLRQLIEDGITVVGPNEGDMACGEFGPGRMAEPDEIVAAIERCLDTGVKRPLEGRTMLVTAGPTYEPIDPVRYLANRSSGKQGYAIAEAAANAGARVVLVTGPTALQPPSGVEFVRVETAREMLDASLAALPCDVAVMAAAVADWRVAVESAAKLKKSGGKIPKLALEENPDILKTVAKAGKKRPALVVGFAAETDNLIANAGAKLKAKGCDWIVANDVSPETGIMGGDANTVSVITNDGVDAWDPMPKDQVARALVDAIAAALAQTGTK